MHQCWQTQPDGRPTFKAIVKDMEEYLAEMMNYFNPLDSNGRRPSDPYITWNLMSIVEEEDDDASSTDQLEQAATAEQSVMIRQQTSKHQANLFEQKQHSLPRLDRSSVIQRFVNFGRSVSLRMKRSSMLNKKV